MAWIVRGKRYDLTNFKHPGGPVSLSLAKGREAEELIFSYHPFALDKVFRILEKYEVKGADPLPQPDTFHSVDTPFAAELKQEVEAYFKTRPRTATAWRWFEYSAMILASLFSLFFYVQGYWAFLFITPVCFWVFGAHTYHDASHFALSTNWFVNILFTYVHPWFSSPITWYYQHVVGHHPFVNMRGKDPDLYHHTPLHRYADFHRFKPLHKHQGWTIGLVWALGAFGMSFISDTLFVRRSVYNHVVPIPTLPAWRRYTHYAGRVVGYLLGYAWPLFFFPLWKALIWCTVPWAIYSFLFLTITQVGHIVDEALEPPPDRDFYKHQILHTHNFGWDNYLTYILCGGLNMQVEHHLFPGVNHCHLIYLAPIVQRLCKKHNIPYQNSSGYWSALASHYKIIKRLSSPNPTPAAH